MASRRTGLLAAWALAAASSLAVGACLFGAEDAKGPCAQKGCDDGNPCTDDVCAADGYCDHSPSTGIPDDGNDCTDDACDGVTAVHAPRTDGASCGYNGMSMCVSGQCTCSEAGDCGESTPCVTFACTGGVCSRTDAEIHTFVDPAGDKDCKKNECDGAGGIVEAADPMDPPDDLTDDCQRPACSDEGEIIEVADDTDVPGDTDGDPCTTEGCSGGVATVQDAENGTTCGPPTCTPSGEGFAGAPAPTCQNAVCTPSAATSCGDYGCNSEGTACRTGCNDSGDCTDAAYCDLGGACVPKLPGGEQCNFGVQCQTGQCAWEGVCCTTYCNFKCWSCKAEYNGGQDGICLPITGGNDPYNDCGGADTCDGDGTC